MTPSQDRLYSLYGSALLQGTLSIRALAKQEGLPFQRVRTVANYTKEHGPPPDVWRVVVIGDAHLDPFEGGMERVDLFASFINQQASEARALGEKFTAGSIGDFDEQSGASSYDRGKASGEMKRIRQSIEYSNQAAERLARGIEPWVYEYMARPPFITLGNHEHRIIRVMNDHPELQGIFALGLEGDDAPIQYNWRDLGWDPRPFLEPLFIEDVGFIHYLPSPRSGQAISAKNKARALLLQAMQGVVVGHSHEFHYGHVTRFDGSKAAACDVGCAFEHNHGWRGPVPNDTADRGLVVLRDLRGAFFQAHFYSFDTMRRLTP